MARRGHNPAFAAPTMFEGAPLFGTALNAALANTHHQQLTRGTPPPRIPGNYPAPHFVPGPQAFNPHQQGHVSRPSMAGFIPGSMPPGAGFGPMPGAIAGHPHALAQLNVGLPMGAGLGSAMGMQMPVPMTMPGPAYPSATSLSSPAQSHGHGRSPSQLQIPQLTPHRQHAPSPSQMQMPNISPGFHPNPQAQLHGHARSPSQLAGLGPSPTNFQQRSRRQPSIGGPPKAALGGPQARKVTPAVVASAAPAASAAAAPAAAGTYEKPKRYVVLLPLEGLLGGLDEIQEEEEVEEGKGLNAKDAGRKRSLWTRQPPFGGEDFPPELDPLLELISHPAYDEFELDAGPPYTAVMPAPGAWDRYKQEMVDSKLASLGYSQPSTAAPQMQMPIPLPAIMAPAHAHSRSLSMTSSFSPGLLQYKLAKLSPTSPNEVPAGGEAPRRLGHQSSLSLSAAAPEFQPRFVFPPRNIASVAEEQEPEEEDTPVAEITLAEAVAVAPKEVVLDKPQTAEDFARGFALDDASEDETGRGVSVEHEGDASGLSVYQDAGEANMSLEGSTFGTAPEPDLSLQASEIDFESAINDEEEDHEREDLSDGRSESEVDDLDEDDVRTLPSHSRRPTATEFPGDAVEGLTSGEGVDLAGVSSRLAHVAEEPEGENDEDPVAEWTASEDVHTGEEELEDVDDDDMSDSMWSNPSDEERARQERLHKRMLKAQGVQQHSANQTLTHSQPDSDPETQVQSPDYDSPRRLPNFPNPPTALLEPEVAYLPTQRSERSYSMNEHSQEDTSEVLSNPSEEAGAVENFGPPAQPLQSHASVYYSQPQSASYPVPFAPIPYPAIDHSPHASITMSHSRSASNTVFSPDGAMGSTALNPHAKPFVFGGAPSRPGSFAGSNPLFPTSPPNMAHLQQNPYPTPPSMTMHGRPGSIPRLNVNAIEFRPTFALPGALSEQGFNFQPPPQAPSLSFEFQAESTRMVDSSDVEDEDGRPTQGREKRRRRTNESVDGEGSQFSEDDDNESLSLEEESDEGEKRERLAGFQFPPPTLPLPAVLQTSPFMRRMTLEPISTDFTFESPNWSARASAPALMPMPVPVATDPEPARLPHSASIPYSHPISTTKVPASLFKALNAYGSDGDSRGKRSRLQSRDFHSEEEFDGVLSDENAALAVSELVNSTFAEGSSRQETSLGQSRTFEMAIQQGSASYAVGLVAPSHAVHRATSMPHMRTPSPAQNARAASSGSMALGPTTEQMEDLEDRIAVLLHEKMAALTDVLTSILAEHASTMSPADPATFNMETLVQKVAEAVESRIQDNLPLALHTRSSASLDNGKPQLEVLKTAIADQHDELRHHLMQGLSEVCREALSARSPGPQQTPDTASLLEAVGVRTEETMSSAMSGFQDLLNNISNLSDARSDDDRELLLSELSQMVLPQIASLRVEPLDVDVLTAQLSEAVKPHISQLIDLASDKKETAGLIIQRLGPLMSSMMPAPLDVAALSGQMAGYVERLMPPPINVKQLKQDILEGLTAVVLDQLGEITPMLKTEDVMSQLKDHLQPLLGLEDLVPAAGTFDNLLVRQEVLHALFETSVATNKNLQASLTSLPAELSVAIQALEDARGQLLQGGQALSEIQQLQTLAAENMDLQRQLAETSGSVTLLQTDKAALEALMVSAQSERETAQAELREVRMELESWKARALDSKTLRDDLEKQVAEQDVEIATARSATVQSREKLAQVEKEKAEIVENNLRLKVQISKLEREASNATREAAVLREKASHLEKSRDEEKAHQTHWDDIRRTAQQVEALTKLIANADEDELQELRRHRDRSKIMEGEFAAMKKRFDEQEGKLANLQRNAIASKNSIAQVQQRSTEWEKKCRTAETELAGLKSERETLEGLRRQLESDMQMLQHRLEDSDRREAEYQAQQGSLEAEVSQLRQQLDYYTAAEQTRSLSQSTSRSSVNGSAAYGPGPAAPYPLRPSTSMSSDDTAFSYLDMPDRESAPTPRYLDMPDREGAPTPRVASPAAGLWASMHAPKEPERSTTPKPTAPAGPAPSYVRAFSASFRGSTRSASPALSSVSNAPTEGDDGWWS
ncbi:hypothetical protein CALVIDRAFT_557757 [Calocera viscosa TUFC12733]|uniref:Uncharacterized protein n=1 Tax=Calocera viscosa (strain TUFC12733) TaxID=1330018 RepID=A0A167HWQ0_CALVF|nr:hypothetical protein CALVIDRAFT_557757 [Calocera viscosa TUFC12733]